MISKNVALLFSVMGLTFALAFAYQFGADLGRGAASPDTSAEVAAYYDLNQLKLYRASEWGQPVPVSSASSTWFDLRAFDDYWLSEHSLPGEARVAPQLLYHDLMIVK